MELIAFTPAAALLLVALAVAHRLDDADACAVLRRLRADHGRGIVSVGAVEAAIAAVVADRAAFVTLDASPPVLLDAVAAGD